LIIKILIVRLLYFLLFYNIIFSQNFVDSFIERYEKTNNYVVEFEYISKNNKEILFKNTGVLLYSNNKFRITIDDVVFIFDGKKYYNIIEENKEVNILKNNELSKYLIPTNLSKILKKDRDKLQILNTDIIKITYIDDLDYKYLIEIDKSYNIIRIDQLLTDTYSNSIFFKKTLFNQKLETNLFFFNPLDYKDYYINEL
tara:strand:- start:83 stop:679 length:597 start_codon:yes stop_codon:yes gene_type:complete